MCGVVAVQCKIDEDLSATVRALIYFPKTRTEADTDADQLACTGSIAGIRRAERTEFSYCTHFPNTSPAEKRVLRRLRRVGMTHGSPSYAYLAWVREAHRWLNTTRRAGSRQENS